MSNLAFGGKRFHAPDVGSLMAAVQMSSDPERRFENRAIGIAEALSVDAPTHGDPIQSRCGNVLRNLAVQALEEAQWRPRRQMPVGAASQEIRNFVDRHPAIMKVALIT